MVHRGLFFVSAAVGLVAAPANGQEWTRFRGPNGTGLSEAKTIPTAWSEKDYNWKVELPGIGHSQPVLWGEKIFLTSAADKGARRFLLCLRTQDGGTIWKKTFESRTHPKHNFNSYASSTPAVDGERVYVAVVTPESQLVVACDHAGNRVWQRDLGPFVAMHGHGASPIVFEDMVVLPSEQGDEGRSFLIALDRKTGETRWRTERRTKRVAYGTPCVYRGASDSPRLLFTSFAHGVSCVDARSGKSIWEADLFDKRTVSSPVVAGGLIIGTCGSGGGGNYLVAVRPGGEGDVTDTHLAYKLRRSIPYAPTPVAKDDRLFLWSGRPGVVSCVVASSGKVLWQERVGGTFFGSPVWVDGRLYSMSTDGEVVVIAAADEFQLLARNDLGEGSRSTPAVAGGRMYLRTYSHLMSIGGKDVGPTAGGD